MTLEEIENKVTGQNIPLDSFQTFGDLLKFLRRREHLTQMELSIAVGYSDAQITRLEKNQRRPDIVALKALFIPALHIENEAETVARLLELAESARLEEAPAQGLPPYKGLLSFEEADTGLFFGREILTRQLADRLANLAENSSTRFLAVVGASGSGKSSLVRAGLAVDLKGRDWQVILLTPGAEPARALDTSMEMVQAEGRVILIVDQFEETFTLCHNDSERVLFIENLLRLAQAPAGKFSIVIALRADFYSHCAQYPQLRLVVATEQEYIGQMTREELRRAIEEPARCGGWEFEPGLVDLLLNDIGAQGTGEPEPGALPLLSHALLATWERRRGRTLTLDGYHASGGVRGAIAETAENVFNDQLNQSQQELAQDIFLRLTELGEGTEDTRRRAALNELVRQSEGATQLRTLLNTLAEARLITLNEDSAEVAHEALIREWQRLHEWLTRDREGLLLHRHLTEAAHEWAERGHDPAELYRGARLAQVREWASANEARLNPTERAFLTASIDQEQHEALEREAQRQRELEVAQKLAETEKARADEQASSLKRLRRRGLYLASAFFLAAGAAIIAGMFASRNNTLASSNAEIAATARANEITALQERQVAQQQSLISSVRELSNAANLNLDVDPELSILLALQAVNKTYVIDQTVLPEAEDALHRAVQASRLELTLRGHTDQVWAAVFSPNGTRIATGSIDGTARIWDTASGKQLLTLQAPAEGGVNSVAFSPDGNLLAVGTDSGITHIWEVSSGKEHLALPGHLDAVVHVAFSPDGSRLATASFDGTAKVWDLTTGKEMFSLREDSAGFQVYWVAFSPDGSKLATSGTDTEQRGWASIWDAKTGQKTMTLPGHGPGMRSVAFSPDGTHMVTANEDRTATVWDAILGRELFTLYGHTDIVEQADFSPDGTRIVTVSDDRKIKVWDAVTGQNLQTLAGHAGTVWSVSFGPDNQHIVTTSGDNTAKVWSISPAQEVLTVVNGSRIVYPAGARLAYCPDGTRLATANSDTAPKVWDVKTGKLLFELVGHTDLVTNIAYSADGTKIGTASNDRTAKIWDAKTGKELQSFTGHTDNVMGIDFSPDGSRLATGSWDGTGIVWDAKTGKPLSSLIGHTDRVGTIDFSPDGSRLVTGSWDGTAIVWDPISGKELVRLIGHDGPVRRAVFSPDGTRIVTASFDGTAKVWEAASGKEVLTLTGHANSVFDAAFSPDGTRIATVSGDRTARVWDAKTGHELWIFQAPDGLTGLAFSPDVSQLAVASRDGTARIYLLKIEDLVTLAKTRVTRLLTTEECQQYLHVETCLAWP
jgi:WD40 repeat protein/transcriptional regulator with XRE-family HTH domain